MQLRSKLVLVAFVSASVVLAQTRTVTGVVNSSLPKFQFLIHEADGDGDSARRIVSIDVQSAGKTVQTIRYSNDEDAPAGSSPGPDVSLEDVNCDGYKDLLVSRFVNVHGESWFYLYRFDPKRGRFVEYAPFSDLPYVDVDCRTKVVKTYVNTGAAGCMYEVGQYRWRNGVLLPVRLESQDTSDGNSFTRTIKIWQKGKEKVLSQQTVPVDDCHAPDEPMRSPRK